VSSNEVIPDALRARLTDSLTGIRIRGRVSEDLANSLIGDVVRLAELYEQREAQRNKERDEQVKAAQQAYNELKVHHGQEVSQREARVKELEHDLGLERANVVGHRVMREQAEARLGEVEAERDGLRDVATNFETNLQDSELKRDALRSRLDAVPAALEQIVSTAEPSGFDNILICFISQDDLAKFKALATGRGG